MEGNRRSFFNKRSNPHFKKKGDTSKGSRPNSRRDQSSDNSSSSDTVYRILCQSRKIGSVIGKGGNIVKALREETRSKITVADSVPGSDERVIIIYSPPTKISGKDVSDENQDPDGEKAQNSFELHCAAQDALLKVHDRIIEEDIGGGVEDNDDNGIDVTARLLVPNNMVGCLLGKKGDVIQRLRSDTGASIRVLPAEHLPACAMSTDELVQISGMPAVVKRALYEVSTLLHQNPRKDKPPLGTPLSYGGHGYHPPGPLAHNLPPQGNPMRSQHHPDYRDGPPMPWMGGYGNQPPRGAPGDFDGGPPVNRGEAPTEISLKILCSTGKIGGVIGKGGFNVRQLQEETGAGIHVEDASPESEERVIRVSSIEAPWDPISQTIEAILQLQDKTIEISEKGIITTRLLVPSSKVGCILGQGGHVINEMRRRTQADIRVFSKEDKPKCAASDEELVQISGNFGVAKDALAEIASRLRARFFRDASAGAEPTPARTVKSFGPSRSLPVDGPYPSGPRRGGTSGGYELVKGGGRDYEHTSYPVPPTAAGYANINSPMDGRMANNVVGSAIGGTNRSEISGPRLKLEDPHYRVSERIIGIRGSSGHLNSPPSTLYGFTAPSGPNTNPPQDYYQNYNTQQSTYPKMNTPENTYHSMSTIQTPYQNRHTEQSPYQNNPQYDPYHVSLQGSYQY